MELNSLNKMIDTKFYTLKSGNKKEFFNNVIKNYHNQRGDICSFSDPTDANYYLYHVFETTVFINNDPIPKTRDIVTATRNTVATITVWGKTEKDLEEKVRATKTLLEKLGGEELIERDIRSGE